MGFISMFKNTLWLAVLAAIAPVSRGVDVNAPMGEPTPKIHEILKFCITTLYLLLLNSACCRRVRHVKRRRLSLLFGKKEKKKTQMLFPHCVLFSNYLLAHSVLWAR